MFYIRQRIEIQFQFEQIISYFIKLYYYFERGFKYDLPLRLQ